MERSFINKGRPSLPSFLEHFVMRRKEILIITLCLIIGFALRFYTFDQKSLWLDEIHTFNDSRDGFREQIKFYKDNPTYLHPPLFFILTHLFYPFTKPERDLRILPLIFGTLSIPMFYILARLFSPQIGILCTLLLTFMTYHISLSQEGRSYSLLMFLGMASLYFFVKHLETTKKKPLFLVAVIFAVLFHMSYSSILFIVFSQILWFYRAGEGDKKSRLSSFMFLNGLTLLFCFPWLLFLLLNFKGQLMMPPLQAKVDISFLSLLYGICHDWTPHHPLMVASAILLLLFPYLSEDRRNALVLLSILILPVGGLYLFCKVFDVAHFVSSRYFINFLPPLFISLSMSLRTIELRLKERRKPFRVALLFVVLFLASNFLILPLYYQSEKEDFRGLVNYLKVNLREGDKIFDMSMDYMPGILHYFGMLPDVRHYVIPFWKLSDGEIEYRRPFVYQGKVFVIYHSRNCCAQYVADGSRLWMVAGKTAAKMIKKNSALPLKGFFDGSFLNFSKFPEDASIYLFLWDPSSPDEKGIDMPIE